MSISEIKSSSGYLGPEPKNKLYEYNLVENRVEKIYKVVVHEFLVADSEDPVLYAAHPLWEWEQTDIGKWVTEHAAETPVWHRQMEPQTLSHRFRIEAKLKEKDYTFWCLKWADIVARQRR
jgi:hypothetical protein